VAARVAPELLERSDPMSTAVGTTNVLAIQTDTMKELTLVEKDPGVEQTAYALLSDLLAIATGPSRW
jgi:homoserine dehydrogenase